MAKKLVLLVHGIGEQRPGDTLNQFVGGVTGDMSCTVDRSLRHLHDAKADADALQAIFPCHTAHVRGADGAREIDTFMAEVFWADLSPTPGGRIQTVISLLQVILSMTNFVRENAQNTMAGWWPLLRALPGFFSGFIVGPFAALNAMLALGWVFVSGAEAGNDQILKYWKWSFDPSTEAHIAIAMTALFAIGLGFYWLGRVRERLFALFNVTLIFYGVFFLCLMAVTLLIDPAIGFPFAQETEGILSMLGKCAVDDNALTERPCDANDWYILWGLLLLQLTWVFAIFGLLVTFLLGAIAALSGRKGGIFPAIHAGQMTLWLMIIGTVWGAFNEMAEQWQIVPELFDGYLGEALQTLPLVWVYILVLLLTGTAIGLWRMRAKSRLEEEDIILGSVVLDDRMNAALIFVGLVMIFVGFVLFGHAMDWFDQGAFLAAVLANGFHWALAIALLVGAVFASVWQQVAIGVGLAQDISSYFLRTPDALKYKTSSEIYRVRDGMHRRFRTVLRRMNTDHPDREVVVVAHSQGTVIALEALSELQREGALSISGGTFVTLGSPYGSIYRTYFYNDFPKRAALWERGHIASWVNIFRRDDYVGTHIEPEYYEAAGEAEGAFPVNIPVAPKGHTNYWTDPNVLPYLRPRVT